MANLAELGRQLQDTNAILSQMERALAVDASSRSILLTMSSLEKRQHALESAFLQEANQIGTEVLSYKLFSDVERPKVSAISRTLDTYQSLVTAVYGALKLGKPRQGGRPSIDTVAESSFDFGYAFPGSVGFVLTIPNQRFLLDIESTLDQSIRTTFEMAKAKTADEIATYAETLGSASVRAMYRWTTAHVSYNLGASIEWRRERNIRDALLIQLPEIDYLRQTIDAVSGESSEQVSFAVTTLTGLQLRNGTFELAIEDQIVRGILSDDLLASLSLNAPLTLPSLYRASLTKNTKTRYSLDRDEETWTLDKLQSLG